MRLPERIGRQARTLPLWGVAALLVAGCGSSHHAKRAVASTTSTVTSAIAQATTPRRGETVTVVLHAPTSEPVAGGRWPITVEAHHRNGRPVNGTVSYAFLFNSAVVARRPGGTMRAGVFHDQLEFPPAALGYPLVLEVLVEGEGGRGAVRRPVKVER